MIGTVSGILFSMYYRFLGCVYPSLIVQGLTIFLYIVNVAKNAVFEPSGCHLLWNILVMAENFAATILYVAFKARKSEKWLL